jgi:TolB-like protein
VISGLSRLLGPFRRRRGLRLAVLPFEADPPGEAGPENAKVVAAGEWPEEVPGRGTNALGAGLAEELIALLSTGTRLEVIGPVSSRALARRTDDPAAAAEELGVDLLLTGTVGRSAGRLTVRARLRTAPEGGVTWSDAWSHGPEDVFLVLGEIAARVAAAAGLGRATPEGTLLHREPTSDLAAWDSYVEGRALLARPSAASIRAAVIAFEEAVEHDELFAGALASIAEAYRTAHELHLSPDRESGLPAIRSGATRALELDDTLPGAYVSLAYAELHAWSLEAARVHLERALELAPCHAAAHRLLARVLLSTGDLVSATSVAERALALEPLSEAVLNESGMPHALAGRTEIAIERSRRVVHRDPEHVMAYFHLGRYAEQAGRHGEAVTYYRAAAELSGRIPYLTAFLGMVLARIGERHEAEEIAADLERKARRGSPVAACLGVLLLRLGRVDEGVRWLEAAHAGHEMQLLLLDTPWLPLPDSRGHPRIRALLEALPRTR